MPKMNTLKKLLVAMLAVVTAASSSVTSFADTASSLPVRTLTMDTRSYEMSPNNIYDFRAKVSGYGLDQANVKVYSSRDGIARVARVPNTDKYRITGVKEGVSYVISEINGVHASIKVTVKSGVKQHGEACRSVSIVGYKEGETLPGINSEMRAVWVPYLSLDMSKDADKSEAAFRKKFDDIVAKAKSSGMNTLIVHVRPFGDSLYPSAYFPWSHLISGTQGQNPGYDPLAYMIQATHAAGMQFHAWVNPLRVQLSGLPGTLSADNPYTKWSNDASKPNWTMIFEGKKYYNPGIADVRTYIADGVKEIVQNYDVDGVQFDDYFYPTQASSIDSLSYHNSGSTLALLDWRRQNISQLVARVYQNIKAVKPNVVFGISPQGNVQNDLNMGADVYTWCSKSGYIDYICPQIYVNFSSAALPFNATVQKWRDMTTNPNIKLYIGLGLYKAGSSADSGTWLKSSSIISQQIQAARSLKADGFMLYSWAYLDCAQTKTEMQNVQSVLN